MTRNVFLYYGPFDSIFKTSWTKELTVSDAISEIEM